MNQSATNGNVAPVPQVTGLIFSLLVLLFSGGVLLFNILTNNIPAEIQVSLVIILGIIALMLLLFVVASGFQRLGLQNRTQPLGLPEGSIRAMIALVLIMVFIIFGIYLFRVVGTGNYAGPIRNLTAAEIGQMKNVGYIIPNTEVGNQGKYDVWLQTDLNADAIRLATQLATTVGTLLVAVAGFYFGSTAVATGVAQGQGRGRQKEPTEQSANLEAANLAANALARGQPAQQDSERQT